MQNQNWGYSREIQRRRRLRTAYVLGETTHCIYVPLLATLQTWRTTHWQPESPVGAGS
jgi:hypothetical protein